MKGDDIAERLEAFAAEVIQIVRALPKDSAGRLMADQLLRSATAGGSNYEEARSAESRRDFVHKIALAAKEVREALYWLGVTSRTEPAIREQALWVRAEGTELVAILMASARTARRKSEAED